MITLAKYISLSVDLNSFLYLNTYTSIPLPFTINSSTS
jgi:hypothetical protein